ncbi:alanine racemase [Escherichia coli]|uniref:Alanine racemase, biosynthetic n=1 Tax=Escherichia coli TaxID=562 RepID=A0A376TN08_ECOLX|nr:alanine racemase [Escherichia coli]
MWRNREKQLAIFNTFCEGKPGQRSIAASGGILLWPQSHFDWVRPGIILYGVSPLEDRSTGADFGCQPVMSLTSSLIAVREHKAGEPVGYGGTWVSERDTRLGVVAMGYGDGYPRARAVRYASAGERSRSTDCRARGDGYDLRRLRSTSAGQSRGSGHFMGRRFARRTYR